MTIGKRISELRKAYGYSQEYVAERLGVSRQAVSKWENNTSAPDTYNLIALAELFAVSVEYLAIGKRPEQDEAPQGAPAPTTDRKGISTQKLIGLLLLGIGLLALILGIWIEEFLIIALAIYCLVGSILCLAVRRHLGTVAAWTYVSMTFVGVSVLTTKSLFVVFYPVSYRYGVTLWHLFAIGFWIFAAVTVTKGLRLLRNRTKTEKDGQIGRIKERKKE